MVEESKSALGRSSGGGHEGVSVEAVPPENVLEFPPDGTITHHGVGKLVLDEDQNLIIPPKADAKLCEALQS
jgi:hypothetical protein